MKKGDVVTINDGSWTRSIMGGKLIHETLGDISKQHKQYVVVEVGCSFPLEYGFSRQPGEYRNDTIIQELAENNRTLSRGKVVLIHKRFLSPAFNSVREVTMAEVCTQFGEDVKIKKD